MDDSDQDSNIGHSDQDSDIEVMLYGAIHHNIDMNRSHQMQNIENHEVVISNGSIGKSSNFIESFVNNSSLFHCVQSNGSIKGKKIENNYQIDISSDESAESDNNMSNVPSTSLFSIDEIITLSDSDDDSDDYKSLETPHMILGNLTCNQLLNGNALEICDDDEMDTSQMDDDKNLWKIDQVDYLIQSGRSKRYYKNKLFCLNCNDRGHLSRDCNLPKKKPTCHLCGLQGHKSIKCQNKLCRKCNTIGHSSDDCHAKLKGNKCKECKESGHKENECSYSWRKYHLTTTTNSFPNEESTPNKIKSCFNCGKNHYGFNCKNNFLKYNLIPQSPLMKRSPKKESLKNESPKKESSKKESSKNESSKNESSKNESPKKSSKNSMFRTIISKIDEFIEPVERELSEISSRLDSYVNTSNLTSRQVNNFHSDIKGWKIRQQNNILKRGLAQLRNLSNNKDICKTPDEILQIEERRQMLIDRRMQALAMLEDFTKIRNRAAKEAKKIQVNKEKNKREAKISKKITKNIKQLIRGKINGKNEKEENTNLYKNKNKVAKNNNQVTKNRQNGNIKSQRKRKRKNKNEFKGNMVNNSYLNSNVNRRNHESNINVKQEPSCSVRVKKEPSIHFAIKQEPKICIKTEPQIKQERF